MEVRPGIDSKGELYWAFTNLSCDSVAHVATEHTGVQIDYLKRIVR